MNRRAIPSSVALKVLTEAGYRCAVPTCRTILAIDLHHLIPVSEGGENDPQNLLALCPTCHGLHHRGTIPLEALRVYKGMLVALTGAFDYNAIDDLIFLYKLPENSLAISGDGVLKFSRLIAAGLAAFRLLMQNGPMVLYQVGVTEKGEAVVNAWMSGDRQALTKAMLEQPADES